MPQKIQVYEKERIDLLDVEYNDFIKRLQETYEVLKSNGVKNIFVESDSEYHGYVFLGGSRLETDEEFNTRISKESKNNENRKNNLKLALKNFSKDCPEEYEQLMKEI